MQRQHNPRLRTLVRLQQFVGGGPLPERESRMVQQACCDSMADMFEELTTDFAPNTLMHTLEAMFDAEHPTAKEVFRQAVLAKTKRPSRRQRTPDLRGGVGSSLQNKLSEVQTDLQKAQSTRAGPYSNRTRHMTLRLHSALSLEERLYRKVYDEAPKHFDGAYEAMLDGKSSDFIFHALQALRDTVVVLRQNHSTLEMLLGTAGANLPVIKELNKTLQNVATVRQTEMNLSSGVQALKILLGKLANLLLGKATEAFMRGGAAVPDVASQRHWSTIVEKHRQRLRRRVKRIVMANRQLRGGFVGKAWSWIKSTASAAMQNYIVKAVVHAGSSVIRWLAINPLKAIALVMGSAAFVQMQMGKQKITTTFCSKLSSVMKGVIPGLSGGVQVNLREEVYKLMPIWTCVLQNFVLAPLNVLRQTIESLAGGFGNMIMTVASGAMTVLSSMMFQSGYKIAGIMISLILDLNGTQQHVLEVAPLICLQPFLRYLPAIQLILDFFEEGSDLLKYDVSVMTVENATNEELNGTYTKNKEKEWIKDNNYYLKQIDSTDENNKTRKIWVIEHKKLTLAQQADNSESYEYPWLVPKWQENSYVTYLKLRPGQYKEDHGSIRHSGELVYWLRRTIDKRSIAEIIKRSKQAALDWLGKQKDKTGVWTEDKKITESFANLKKEGQAYFSIAKNTSNSSIESNLFDTKEKAQKNKLVLYHVFHKKLKEEILALNPELKDKPEFKDVETKFSRLHKFDEIVYGDFAFSKKLYLAVTNITENKYKTYFNNITGWYSLASNNKNHLKKYNKDNEAEKDDVSLRISIASDGVYSIIVNKGSTEKTFTSRSNTKFEFERNGFYIDENNNTIRLMEDGKFDTTDCFQIDMAEYDKDISEQIKLLKGTYKKIEAKDISLIKSNFEHEKTLFLFEEKFKPSYYIKQNNTNADIEMLFVIIENYSSKKDKDQRAFPFFLSIQGHIMFLRGFDGGGAFNIKKTKDFLDTGPVNSFITCTFSIDSSSQLKWYDGKKGGNTKHIQGTITKIENFKLNTAKTTRNCQPTEVYYNGTNNKENNLNEFMKNIYKLQSNYVSHSSCLYKCIVKNCNKYLVKKEIDYFFIKDLTPHNNNPPTLLEIESRLKKINTATPINKIKKPIQHPEQFVITKCDDNAECTNFWNVKFGEDINVFFSTNPDVYYLRKFNISINNYGVKELSDKNKKFTSLERLNTFSSQKPKFFDFLKNKYSETKIVSLDDFDSTINTLIRENRQQELYAPLIPENILELKIGDFEYYPEGNNGGFKYVINDEKEFYLFFNHEYVGFTIKINKKDTNHAKIFTKIKNKDKNGNEIENVQVGLLFTIHNKKIDNESYKIFYEDEKYTREIDISSNDQSDDYDQPLYNHISEHCEKYLSDTTNFPSDWTSAANLKFLEWKKNLYKTYTILPETVEVPDITTDIEIEKDLYFVQFTYNPKQNENEIKYSCWKEISEMVFNCVNNFKNEQNKRVMEHQKHINEIQTKFNLQDIYDLKNFDVLKAVILIKYYKQYHADNKDNEYDLINYNVHDSEFLKTLPDITCRFIHFEEFYEYVYYAICELNPILRCTIYWKNTYCKDTKPLVVRFDKIENNNDTITNNHYLFEEYAVLRGDQRVSVRNEFVKLAENTDALQQSKKDSIFLVKSIEIKNTTVITSKRDTINIAFCKDRTDDKFVVKFIDFSEFVSLAMLFCKHHAKSYPNQSIINKRSESSTMCIYDKTKNIYQYLFTVLEFKKVGDAKSKMIQEMNKELKIPKSFYETFNIKDFKTFTLEQMTTFKRMDNIKQIKTLIKNISEGNGLFLFVNSKYGLLIFNIKIENKYFMKVELLEENKKDSLKPLLKTAIVNVNKILQELKAYALSPKSGRLYLGFEDKYIYKHPNAFLIENALDISNHEYAYVISLFALEYKI